MSSQTQPKKPASTAASRHAPIVYEMPTSDGKKRPPRKKRDQVAEELTVELGELRANLEAATEHFRLRVAGQLAEINRALEGQEFSKKQKRLSAKVATAMLQELRAVTLRPEKGRPKDLARISDLVKTLYAFLPAED